MTRIFASTVLFAAFTASAMAEVVEFIVDPALTRWSVRGAHFRGSDTQGDFEPQFPGSEITSLTGILRVDLTPTTIQFLPGSVLDAVPQPLPQQPGIGGTPGTAPADYGVASPALGDPVPVFAVRDFGFSVSSSVLPLFNENLFQEDLEAVVNARLDYDLGSANGSYSFTNWQRGFDDDNVGRITTDGLIQTIRLQNYLGDILALENPADSFIEWSDPHCGDTGHTGAEQLAACRNCSIAQDSLPASRLEVFDQSRTAMIKLKLVCAGHRIAGRLAASTGGARSTLRSPVRAEKRLQTALLTN